MFNAGSRYRSVVYVFGFATLFFGTAIRSIPAQTPTDNFSAEQKQQLDEAEKLIEKATELGFSGKPKEAAPLATRALAIRKQILGNEHAETAKAMDIVGIQHYFLGDLLAARGYYEQSLKIKLKTLGEENAETSATINNLGHLMNELGDFAAARTFYEKSLKIKKKVLGDEHPDTAIALSNMGQVLHRQGENLAARTHFEQALAICRKLHGDNDESLTLPLNNLASLLSEQGDHKSAQLHFKESLRIIKATRGNEHPVTATAINNLGSSYYSEQKYAAALPYYEEALRIRKKVLGEDHPDTGTSLNNMGTLLQSQHKYAEALPYLERALKITLKIFGEDHPNSATSLNNVGLIYVSQRDFPTAREYTERALRARKKIFGDDHPDTVGSYYQLANIETLLGHWAEAAQFLDQARRGMRRHVARVLPALSETEQLLFLADEEEWKLHTALSFAFIRRDDSQVAATSASWLLNGKAVAQTALADRALLTRDSQNPELKPIIQKLLEIREQSATLSLRVAPPGQEAARQEALRKLLAEEDRLARELTEKSGRTTLTDPWVELSQVRKAIPHDGVLIDFARFDVFDFQSDKYQPARYVAWIIPAAGKGNIQVVDLGLALPLETAVDSARKAIQSATEKDGLLRQQGEEAAEKQARKALQTVGDLIWKPLADKLGGAKQIILSPDGALWLVPWSALPIAGEKVLLEAYPLHYVVSGRDVIPSTVAKQTLSRPTLFSDPDFDLGPEKIRLAIQENLPHQKFKDDAQTRGMAAEKNALPRVARLPNTAAEAHAIAPNIARFTKEEPKIYSASNALESIVKDIQRPSLLVLSTHGFFLSEQDVKVGGGPTSVAVSKPVDNPLLRCGLLLAGCNSQQSTANDDGILTGMEIVGIDLRGTELVVLSACETGIGKIQYGEGVAGLRQAFQLAGAKSVVATLWQVPDRDSMLIMNDFFQNLADGQSKTDALRNAQLKRIQTRRDKNGAAHPFFWAAWTLTGE